MFCSTHSRVLLLFAAIGLGCFSIGQAAAQDLTRPPNHTAVHLRWGSRSGVSSYRLQIARDSGFADIVLDRVVRGNDFEINELEPGRYFWRVAALTRSLGEFSSAGVIDVQRVIAAASPSVTPLNNNLSPAAAGGGWRAAIGNITDLMTARLRGADRTDLVAVNAAGSVFAIDAASGVPLWSFRAKPDNERAIARASVLVVPNRLRLENVVVLQGTQVVEIDGATGRELWRANLPGPASAAATISDRSGTRLLVIDDSRQRMFIVSGADGRIAGQLTLPARLVGPPVPLNDRSGMVLAYQSGDIEIRDTSGAVIRSANVGSTATTPPLLVRAQTGELILLGTRAGLSAINLADLRALGRVSVPNDAPRGRLVAQDLDGDGVAEVIMSTERGHLIAVNAASGKIIWDAPAQDYGDALSFADLNSDRVLDVFVSGERKLAMALSGRDGSLIWKDSENSTFVTNHATTSGTRDLVAIPSASGVMLIAVEPSGTGLRAVTFSNAQVRPQLR
jgi:outer membrane protein assembly factor BamB